MKRANGMGTVYKLKGNRRRPWIAKKDGQTIGYYATKKEGLFALEKLTDRIITDSFNLTFEDVYMYWSKEHFPNMKDPYIYEWAFKNCPELHTKKYRTLRTHDFQKVIDSHKDFAKATLQNFRHLFAQMGRWALKNEVITEDFSKYVEMPKKKEVKKEKPKFTNEEIEKLIQDDSAEARATLMMIYTGMRIGELFAITPKDVHEGYDYLIGGEKTEAGIDRVIAIPAKVRPYFEWFCKEGKLPWAESTFRNYYKTMFARLGMEYKPPHSCRRTFASICSAAGVPQATIMALMGHKSFKTTADYYIKNNTDDLVNAVKDL